MAWGGFPCGPPLVATAATQGQGSTGASYRLSPSRCPTTTPSPPSSRAWRPRRDCAVQPWPGILPPRAPASPRLLTIGRRQPRTARMQVNRPHSKACSGATSGLLDANLRAEALRTWSEAIKRCRCRMSAAGRRRTRTDYPRGHGRNRRPRRKHSRRV